MLITIHCGGMPFNGDTVKTESLGGSETAAYYVAKELSARGHRVTLFTNHQVEGTFDGVKYVWAGAATAEAPLGDRFNFYASNTPCDVLMIQRQPGAFMHTYQAKLNICWLHDLPLYRQRPLVSQAMWNIDSVFCVSDFHKQRVCEVYGFAPDFVKTVTNGIDLGLFSGDINTSIYNLSGKDRDWTQGTEIKLLYSSRPERGIDHLVRPGGIMDRLADIDPRYHLYACTYANTQEAMANYYAMINSRCAEMRNVTQLPSLSKKHLADVMRQCDALVYPTEFEDTSCITLMEAMAAGLPILSSEIAALPETAARSGATLIPLLNGAADEDAFVEAITKLSAQPEGKKRAAEFDWPVVAARFEQHFLDLFAERGQRPESVLAGLIHNSDYYAAEIYARDNDLSNAELTECYEFARTGEFSKHYEAYYEYEKNRGINYGPEDCTNNSRYRTVADSISDIPAGRTVLDYGCAHGHYTINLAKQRPDLRFVGIDITQRNIDSARAWAIADGVVNVEFALGDISTGALPVEKDSLAAIIAAEVLEHVAEPWLMVDALAEYLAADGRMICTTPVGPWEASGYKTHWPWRAHIHHFENADINDVFGKHPNFKMALAPAGHAASGEALGSFVFSFDRPIEPSGRIDYQRKIALQAPRQTLSVCIIAKNSEHTIGKCLESIADIADEVIVAIDDTCTDDTLRVVENFVAKNRLKHEIFLISSPLKIGFDAARNQTIERATGDWILWIDADEVLFGSQNIHKHLRKNMFSAYAIKQIHYSVEPEGVMKTDLPTRFFRNHLGIKFFGVVHEHPEIEMNRGIGHAAMMGDAVIAHYGYTTEKVRRQRFERNIPLLVRDREIYPDRVLGKFLWFRDLAQMCRWEAEANGGQISEAMRERAARGIEIWSELLDAGQMRMLADQDNLNLYSILVQVSGVADAFDFGFQIDASKLNGGAHPERQPPLTAKFHSRAAAQKFVEKTITEKTVHYDSKYF